MASSTGTTETMKEIWFRDNDTFVSMRFWGSDFLGIPAGHLSMDDVKFTITHDYPGGVDGFIDNHDEPRDF